MSAGIILPNLADPVAPAPLIAAVSWIEQTMLGSIATSIAVIAVAVVGLMMLRGQLQARRGIIVVVGCFVLFGAPVLAAGIRGIATSVLPPPPVIPAPPPPEPMPFVPPPMPMMPPPPPPPSNEDPYAGASVPAR